MPYVQELNTGSKSEQYASTYISETDEHSCAHSVDRDFMDIIAQAEAAFKTVDPLDQAVARIDVRKHPDESSMFDKKSTCSIIDDSPSDDSIIAVSESESKIMIHPRRHGHSSNGRPMTSSSSSGFSTISCPYYSPRITEEEMERDDSIIKSRRMSISDLDKIVTRVNNGVVNMGRQIMSPKIRILTNVNLPHKRVDIYYHEPRIPVTSFEDEFYALKMNRHDDGYFSNTKYRSNNHTDTPSVPNHWTYLNTSQPTASLDHPSGATTPVSSTIHSVKPQSEKIQRKFTSDTNSLIRNTFVDKNMENENRRNLSSFNQNSEPVKTVAIERSYYSTVKERRLHNERENLKILEDLLSSEIASPVSFTNNFPLRERVVKINKLEDEINKQKLLINKIETDSPNFNTIRHRGSSSNQDDDHLRLLETSKKKTFYERFSRIRVEKSRSPDVKVEGTLNSFNFPSTYNLSDVSNLTPRGFKKSSLTNYSPNESPRSPTLCGNGEILKDIRRFGGISTLKRIT